MGPLSSYPFSNGCCFKSGDIVAASGFEDKEGGERGGNGAGGDVWFDSDVASDDDSSRCVSEDDFKLRQEPSQPATSFASGRH